MSLLPFDTLVGVRWLELRPKSTNARPQLWTEKSITAASYADTVKRNVELGGVGDSWRSGAFSKLAHHGRACTHCQVQYLPLAMAKGFLTLPIAHAVSLTQAPHAIPFDTNGSPKATLLGQLTQALILQIIAYGLEIVTLGLAQVQCERLRIRVRQDVR